VYEISEKGCRTATKNTYYNRRKEREYPKAERNEMMMTYR